ncbi:MAG: bifunctional histidinol-phosphatase/imidazoleglycerol-phosphate dehydratase HisB [Cytophagales bacterium]|nr:bifunctional histidinol-phosphatase/imidazoleglycerol-phosphate dehydratase HisB [Cytophagales bacterium]
MATKILFIDRDGTLIAEPKDNFQIDSYDKLEFIPGVIHNLVKIVQDTDYKLVMVTNQDGLGTESFPEHTFWPAHNLMLKILANEGIIFHNIHIDRSFEHENKPTRKPGTAMLKEYIKPEYDLSQSVVIGDRTTDVMLANNLGSKSIFLNWNNISPLPIGCTMATQSWDDIYKYLKNPPRSAIVERNTNETKIHINLNIDGSGLCNIHTGLGFFDHMLEQLGKHSGADLQITVKGDLHIDEHHTIEDTALALGEAYANALGNKKGIERYGWLLPMDEALAQAAIDFSGRPWLVWDVVFNREKIGEMPTEMFYHFWKSFTDTAKCNLNIKCEGDNEHHKIEAIFKAVAKSIKMAVRHTGQDNIPSTKGVL